MDDDAAMRAMRELGWQGSVVRAETFAARLWGLRGVGAGVVGGLLFDRCRSVHTCFMAERIDVAFLDAAGCVLETHEHVGPWRFLRCAGARAVLERRSG